MRAAPDHGVARRSHSHMSARGQGDRAKRGEREERRESPKSRAGESAQALVLQTQAGRQASVVGHQDWQHTQQLSFCARLTHSMTSPSSCPPAASSCVRLPLRALCPLLFAYFFAASFPDVAPESDQDCPPLHLGPNARWSRATTDHLPLLESRACASEGRQVQERSWVAF